MMHFLRLVLATTFFIAAHAQAAGTSRPSGAIATPSAASQVLSFTSEGGDGKIALVWLNAPRIEARAPQPSASSEPLLVDLRQPEEAITSPLQTDTPPSGNSSTIMGLVGFILILIYFLVTLKHVGRAPASGPILLQKTPPAGISAGLAGVIDYNGMAKSGRTALAATLLELAISGYLVIDTSGRWPRLQSTDAGAAHDGSDAALSQGQHSLLAALDAVGGVLTLTPTEIDRLEDILIAFRISLDAENAERYITANRKPFFLGLLASLTVTLVWMRTSGVTSDTIGTLAFSCFMPFLLGLLGWKLYCMRQRARSTIGRTICTLGLGLVGAVAAMSIAVYMGILTETFDGTSVVLAFFVTWGLVWANQLFYLLIRSLTPEGRQIKDQLEGLKAYMLQANDAADAQALRQDSILSHSHFETLLPFAVALGIEKDWGRAFETWLQGSFSGAMSSYAPTWCNETTLAPSTDIPFLTNKIIAAFDTEVGDSLSDTCSGD